MKKLPSSYLEPKIFDNKYIIKQQLSSGSFGVVYLAIHKVTREEVAIKLEKGEQETLDREVYLLTKLQGIQGITKLYWFGNEQNYNVMVIELLGKDLGYYVKHYKQLSLKTGLQLLEQLITIFNQVHNEGVVHRDLKPENIMIGKINSAQAYLVDFGVSKQFFHKGKHIPFRDNKSFIGTTRYASIASHKGYEIGRKDDLESLMYVIIYLILGKLPWQNLQDIGDKDRTIVVGEVKMQTSIQQLCKDLPYPFSEYLNYLKGLNYQDQPDYELLKKIMRQCSDANTYDNQFEWTDKIQMIYLFLYNIFQIQQTIQDQLNYKITIPEKLGDIKQQSSFLAVPNGLNDQQRQNTKKQSYMGSQSSNIVKYIPSCQDALPINSQPQKMMASQPHLEVLKQVDTIDFDDIEENMKNYPTLEQKLMILQGFNAKFKEECISHSAIHVFDH